MYKNISYYNFKSWRKFILGNKIGITVDPYDVSEIREAMKFFIENPQKLNIMEENAKNYL